MLLFFGHLHFPKYLLEVHFPPMSLCILFFVVMGQATSSNSVFVKPAVPSEILDEHIERIGDIQGKVEQICLVDIIFSDGQIPFEHLWVFIVV
jgi:hypothetical protein